MKKIITGTLGAAAAVAALSACGGGNGASDVVGATAAPATITAAAPRNEVPATPDYTVAQQNAIQSATSYLEITGFSRAGLIQQLSSEYGDKYAMADAIFAVDHIEVDWNAEAVESAKAYLEVTGFSRDGLIQQLSSEYGEQFTLEQATYAADQVGL